MRRVGNKRQVESSVVRRQLLLPSSPHRAFRATASRLHVTDIPLFMLNVERLKYK